jgi:uncharacterized iron-regulated membrane protein
MGRRRWMTQFWRHPQQLWLRRAMFQVHLWLGVALGAYIVAIGISGSILVFKDELMPRPHVLLTPAACTAERLAAGLQAAVLVHPGWTPVLASCPIEGDPWITVNLSAPANETGGKQETEYIDPGSGRVAGSVVRDRTWVGWVERLHLDLLLRRGGSTWNGVGAVVLLLLVGSGLVLWWPGIRHWARGFTVDLRRSWKRINWDLHNAVGIWTVLFTLIWGVTGVYFTWPRPFERVVAAVSPIPTALYPAAEVARLGRRPPPRLGQAAPEVSTLLRNAQRGLEGTRLEGCYFGSGPAPLFTVYLARGRMGDFASTDFVFMDQLTGERLLLWRRGLNRTLGDWIVWSIVPLHFGTSWGLAGKIVWCGLGLGLPLLALTGWLMYWNRWLRKQIPRRR